MQTVKKLLEEKETFVTNMKKATEIATNDPGAGIGALKFYTDLLIRNGNADHLTNRVILNQSINEIYDLDIVVMFFVILLGFIVGSCYCFMKCLKFCYRKIMTKRKIE